MDGADKDLQHCRGELLRLLNENAALRYAAKSFGDLAERLNLIVSRYQRLGLLPAAFPEYTMAKPSNSVATPMPAPRVDDVSTTRTPEGREHVGSKLPPVDAKLHPGGASAVPVDPGMGSLRREDVPGIDVTPGDKQSGPE
jgi:hypothetical protein